MTLARIENDSTNSGQEIVLVSKMQLEKRFAELEKTILHFLTIEKSNDPTIFVNLLNDLYIIFTQLRDFYHVSEADVPIIRAATHIRDLMGNDMYMATVKDIYPEFLLLALFGTLPNQK